MRIGTLSRQTGVDPDTIRYYEREGLLPSPAREANGYRHYTSVHIERLRFIRHCRALEISLSEIGRLLTLLASPANECGEIDSVIDQHLAAVHQRRAELAELESQLMVLRQRCAHHQTVAQCGIAEELKAAASGDSCICHRD
ncbi:Cd(II)/Pb(II)-responsive transcriptional regulator [Marinobacterium sp. D7]|uniref:Cd(II)/Pb(II)-responsive transcriptional regulator n=1 Tax=Marinobacterium ramblicola TaxID=2849041 RepID=UPI001C2D6BEB|nr:Cd(II)/Pb(II)-responsive transcriptional regulator [Marinobacterium ramblicola]MBV1790416.1 Cd(II)/Pb(II)-responsive transcriptional regulator [Marinobacterium ramblicola]